MKFLCALSLFGFVVLSLCGCKKDTPTRSCEIVANANGPTFLQVKNQFDEEVVVDMTDAIPLRSFMDPGACEIFGLPDGFQEIVFEKNNGAQSKSVIYEFVDDETVEVIVDGSFF